MEFLPLDEFEEISIDTQNIYVEEKSIDIPKINLSMIKEEESHNARKRQRKALMLFKNYFYDLGW